MKQKSVPKKGRYKRRHFSKAQALLVAAD